VGTNHGRRLTKKKRAGKGERRRDGKSPARRKGRAKGRASVNQVYNSEVVLGELYSSRSRRRDVEGDGAREEK